MYMKISPVGETYGRHRLSNSEIIGQSSEDNNESIESGDYGQLDETDFLCKAYKSRKNSENHE